jgi:hypothetical protein
MRVRFKALLWATVLAVSATGANAAEIILHNQGGVEEGTDAYRGFRAAADFWASRITNDIDIHLNVDFSALPVNVLGGATSTRYFTLTQNVYAGLQAQASSSLDSQAIASLQPLTASQFAGVGGINMVTPGYTGFDVNGVGFGINTASSIFDADGTGNNVLLAGTSANFKALGLLADQSISDGKISFSSAFDFDFDPRDGVEAGHIDFIGVAIHEIGHTLGFVSGVDDYDGFGSPAGRFSNADCDTGPGVTLCRNSPVNDNSWGSPGDLFRYGDVGFGPTLVWKPGAESYFSIDGGVTNLANFSTGENNGDGWQASHWKAPTAEPFCADLVGILNPYVCSGEVSVVTGLDFAFFDAIGYNFNFAFDPDNRALFTTAEAYNAVPEPATWALLIGGFGAMGSVLRRRRQATLTR